LRPLTTLDGPNVRLGDLFDDTGQDAGRVLGSAPQPGARIVVEAAQLAAIARQFGVDWRPASLADHAVIERPGRLLPRSVVIDALRTTLHGVGAGEDLDIDIGGFAAPMVPPTAQVEATVEQLDWDGGSGRFTGLLALSAEGMALQRLRLAGTAQEMLLLPVPNRRLNAGQVLQEEDLHLARVRAGLGRGEVVRETVQAVGQTLKHQAVPGQPLAIADLARTPTVQKGARVTMRLQGPGLALAAFGQALEAGGTSEQIRVLNPSSRAVVVAEVVGPEEVRVMPGSQPLFRPSGRTAQLDVPNWNTP
jgi:flagella basal body P-ring formation protein FlgA